MDSSPYYKDTGRIPLASRISVRQRTKIYAKFVSSMPPNPRARVLDIGVTSDDQYQESNYFERLYPYKDRVVCVGTEDGSYLEVKYPGIKFIKVEPHKPLPFEDGEFDISFTNAVIEHVGDRDSQRAFVLEMLRVSRGFFLTTPNRWFPMEFHTAIPLLHFLPPRAYRRVLAALRQTHWSEEANLNLLDRRELRDLFPEDSNLVMDGVHLLGMCTNLIAHGGSGRRAYGTAP
jgi:hypothetical protein